MIVVIIIIIVFFRTHRHPAVDEKRQGHGKVRGAGVRMGGGAWG